MALFKSKVKSFFKRDKGPEEEDAGEERIHALQPADLPQTREDPRKIDEIIDEVDGIYLRVEEEEHEGDCSLHELQKLGIEIDMSSLEDRIFSLKTQDNAVYRKIYDLVIANYTAYVQELENVTMLQLSLQDAASTCISARRRLRHAKEGVSHGGLGLLSKHRKRERLNSLLDILKTLKTLQRTDARLKQLLEEGDYPAATQLCIECQQAIETYKHYTCVRELAVSLQDIQTDIETELEAALAKMCQIFNTHRYHQVQEAYRILGKTQTAVDTLLMKFTTTVHDRSYAVVAGYVRLGDAATNMEDPEKLKMPYVNLCKMINGEHFIDCLKDICQVLWRVMHNYREVKRWHEVYERQRPVAREAEERGVEAAELSLNRSYLRQKLERGLLRVWRDVQQKVRPYIAGVDMAHFKYDAFIRVLDIVNRLISIGVQFCGEGSDALQESMRQQSLKYFRNYHRARLDDLRIFLETEAWELCPVRASFTVHRLREFRFMRGLSTASLCAQKPASPSKESDTSVFSRMTLGDNPFEEQEEEEEEGEDVIDPGSGVEEAVSDDERTEDEDIAEALRRAYVREDTGDSPKNLRIPGRQYRQRSLSSPKGPLLANTTLTVIRFVGSYMQMMSVLQPIAFDVLECLSHLFDYYLCAVHDFFANDLLEVVEGVELSTKLTTSLRRISDTLILTPQDFATATSPSSSEDVVKVYKPSANPVVDLSDPQTLYGLRYRMVAVESLVFLASQFETLLPYLENLIPTSKKSFLTQFFSHTVNTAHELRRPVYCGIASRAVAYDQVLQSMSPVKWDIKEIMSQHSSYVDRLLQEFVNFKELQSSISRHFYIPPPAYNMLWEHAVKLANRTFVEGFAQARKCSNEGRALMQLDFQQFRTKLEKLSEIRPLPNHTFVEDYIKAFYLSESDTEDWLRKHQEYSVRQLQTLVLSGVGARINKRSRQKLMAIIEERR